MVLALVIWSLKSDQSNKMSHQVLFGTLYFSAFVEFLNNLSGAGIAPHAALVSWQSKECKRLQVYPCLTHNQTFFFGRRYPRKWAYQGGLRLVVHYFAKEVVTTGILIPLQKSLICFHCWRITGWTPRLVAVLCHVLSIPTCNVHFSALVVWHSESKKDPRSWMISWKSLSHRLRAQGSNNNFTNVKRHNKLII